VGSARPAPDSVVHVFRVSRHQAARLAETCGEGGKPLAAPARRAGWVGCNIALNRVPAEARIFLVRTTVCEPRNAAVPAAGSSGVPPRERTRSGTPREPAGADACATNPIIVPPEEVRAQFKRVKPLKDNRNVRPKIRQQLQVLRDGGLLIHIDRGEWRLP